MVHDVFISHHTKSCLKVTEAICHSLEEKGIRVWYAPRDTQDSYARNIMEVIRDCKVFILILNHESSESFDVLNEINCVSERLRRKEPVHVIPFQIADNDISADAKYYLGRLHWLDAITPPLEKRIEELTDRVCYILNQKEENVSYNIIENNTNKLISSNLLNNVHFIGRQTEISEIRDILEQNKRVFLQGIGGIGKSEIAKKYAQVYRQKYDTIVFAKYNNNIKQLIVSDNVFHLNNFCRIKNSNGILENDNEFYERKINAIKMIAQKSRILIIIDNFDVLEDENLEDFLEGSYDIIITTRNDFSYLGLPILKVNAINNKDDLLNIFEQNFGARIFSVDEKNYIFKIFDLFQGHTLAIELIAKYIKRTRKKPSMLYEILKKDGITPKLQGNINHFFENNTIYQYIKFLFDLSKISKEENDILANLTFFSINGVPFDLFMNLSQYEDAFAIDELIRKNWIQHNWETDYISLHPLIIDVVKNECNPNLESCKVLFRNISQIDSWKIHQDERISYETIVLNIYNNYIQIKEENIENFTGIAKFLRDLGYYEQSEDLLLRILEKQIQFYSEISPQVAKTYDLLRFVNNKSYNVEKANYYNEKSIKILKKLPEEQYLLADCMKSRAFSYLKNQEPKEAEKLLMEIERIYTNILPKEHYKIGNMYIAFSRLNYQFENYEKALEYAQSSYNILSLKYGAESNDIATALMAIGAARCKLGDTIQGIKALKESVRIRKLNFHKDDFSIMDAYEYLADGLIDAKEFNEAKEYLYLVLNCFKAKMPKTDKWFIRIKNKLDNIESEKGD